MYLIDSERQKIQRDRLITSLTSTTARCMEGRGEISPGSQKIDRLTPNGKSEADRKG